MKCLYCHEESELATWLDNARGAVLFQKWVACGCPVCSQGHHMELNGGDRVVFGATVTVFDPDRDTEMTYKIVNTCVSSTELGHISYQAPIARALIGKEIGDEVTVKLPSGERTLEILEVDFV